MTPEQEALVEALRLFAADQGIGFDRMHDQMAAGLIEPIGEDLCDSTFSVTPAGALVLAIAAERDLWRLKAEYLKAAQKYDQAWHDFPNQPTETESHYLSDVAERYRQARAAYVAAGGEP